MISLGQWAYNQAVFLCRNATRLIFFSYNSLDIFSVPPTEKSTMCEDRGKHILHKSTNWLFSFYVFFFFTNLWSHREKTGRTDKVMEPYGIVPPTKKKKTPASGETERLVEVKSVSNVTFPWQLPPKMRRWKKKCSVLHINCEKNTEIWENVWEIWDVFVENVHLKVKRTEKMFQKE